jgi:hypothetical protein
MMLDGFCDSQLLQHKEQARLPKMKQHNSRFKEGVV